MCFRICIFIIAYNFITYFVYFGCFCIASKNVSFSFLIPVLWTLQHNKAQNVNVSLLLLQQQQQQQLQQHQKEQQQEEKQQQQQWQQNADKPCAVLVATVALSGWPTTQGRARAWAEGSANLFGFNYTQLWSAAPPAVFWYFAVETRMSWQRWQRFEHVASEHVASESCPCELKCRCLSRGNARQAKAAKLLPEQSVNTP